MRNESKFKLIKINKEGYVMLKSKKLQTVVLALSLTTLLSSCTVFEGRETTGQYIDDSTITATVKKNIIACDTLKTHDITVETLKGVVQLSGFVQTAHEKHKAEEVARKVDGVNDVRNSLQVR